MDAQEILKQAWEAVEQSGVPKTLHEVAFREAVQIMRDGGDATAKSGQSKTAVKQTRRTASAGGRARRGNRSTRTAPAASTAQAIEIPDENTFFSNLAKESGADETDLRDILTLLPDGTVQIDQPARELGGNAADQARTVIVLVAGARSKGLGENPVSAEAVRAECRRKHCYQSNNFAAKHLGPLRGFNGGSTSNEIVVNSKWVGEFAEAVDRLHGRGKDAPAGS